MKIYKNLFLILLIILSMSSCTSQKKLIYLQNAEGGTVTEEVKFTYTFRPGDIIAINVYSLNENAARIFNVNKGSVSTATSYYSEQATYINGFFVSDSGYIKLPIIGDVMVQGLNREETSLLLTELMQEYFFDAIVDVKLANFKFTILGEVQRPNTYKVYDTRINIFEAIGMAGDLNVYGRREIILVRQVGDSQIVFDIDLKSKNIMSQDYYYVLPNDIIYVKPHKSKIYGFSTVPITLIFTTISTLILIINFLK